jgi:peptidoglycan/LPS O-acetylase OafA/YrhL
MIVSSFAVTLLLAVASWHLVEERALKLKGKVSRSGKAWLGKMPTAFR